jgi:hypothetical protein
MIQPRCAARLVFAVGFSALGQPRPMAAVFAAVALTAVAGTADIKHDAAFRAPAHSLSYLDFRQGSSAFPKAGLDNGRQSWQARGDYDGSLTGSVRLRPQSLIRLGPFFFRLPEDNKPSQKNKDHAFVCWAGLTEKKKTNCEAKTEEKGKGSLTTFQKLLRRIFNQTQNIIKLAT